MTDLRYTIRSLLRARWFTVAAVLTFAVGIGLNVAVFSIVDRVLFRPLPYGNLDRLVLLRACSQRGICGSGAFPSVVAFEGRQRLKTIDAIAVAGFSASLRLSDAADDRPLRLNAVSANLLEVVGVRPVLGRDFKASDVAERRHLALIGYHTWQARFQGSADVIGKTLGSGKMAVTIVGVLPADFIPPSWSRTDPAWEGITLTTDSNAWTAIRPTGSIAAPVARLAPGASLESARAEVEALAAALEPELRQHSGRLPHIRIDPIQSSLFSRFSDHASLIVAATAVLLLLACANLATLLLARGRSREHAVAIHAAIGAGPRRLILTSVAESVLICAAGATVAIVTVSGSMRALLVILPPLFARYATGVFEWRVLVTALIVAFVCALVAGVGPAFRAARVDVLTLLQRSSGPARTARVHGGRALLAIEAALGVALVLSGIVIVRSFTTLSSRDLGFEPRGLYAVSVRRASDAPVTAPKGKAAVAAYKQLIDMLARMSGVEVAAGADTPIAAGFGPMRGLTNDDSVPGARFQVTANYFQAIRTRFLAGRAFTESEVAAHASVGVLNLSGVRAFFADEQPTAVIGRTITVDNEPPRTVVGVIPDLKEHYNGAPEASLFVPLGAEPSSYPAAVIRMGQGNSPRLLELQQRLTTALGYRVIPHVSSMADWVDRGLTDPRFRAVLFSVLAGAALLLAAVGLFAVASFETVSRRYEMGVRLTLGAQRSQIRRMVLLDACRPIIVGVALGLVAAYWGERYLQSFMYGMQPRDPVIYASVIVILLGTALLAAWLPASRAARLDPADVLRAH